LAWSDRFDTMFGLRYTDAQTGLPKADRRFSINIGGHYRFSERLGLAADVATGEGGTSWFIGPRLSF